VKFPQLAQSSAHARPISALHLDDSPGRIPIVDLKEIRRLSRFLLLIVLIRNERRVISSDELLDEEWRYENYPRKRTVDKHILRLRQKLEREPPRPAHFRTVQGVGYKFLP
jgi:DNA-binding response OmpR family regulator